MVRLHLGVIFLGLFLNECLSKHVCESEGCKAKAQRILDYMDPTVRPCDDFYRFACGNFLDTAEIRDDQFSNSSFVEVDEKLASQLKSILFQKPKHREACHIRTMKQFLALCMDEKNIDARGVGPGVAVIESAGGWPVLQDSGIRPRSMNWEVHWSLLETEKRLREISIGYGSLFNIGVTVDMKNNRKHVLMIDQPDLGLVREFLVKGEDDPTVQAYYKYMVDIAVLYGADRDIATSQLRDSLLFEIGLAKITSPQEERRDYNRMYNPYSLQKLMAEIGWINWEEMLQSMMPKSVSLRKSELVIVAEVEYIKKLEQFVKQYPNKVIANYMMWKTAKSLVPLLSAQMRDRELEYAKVLLGTATKEPRWKTCVNQASNFLSLAVSSMYVRKFFDKSTKKVAEDMTERIRQEIIRDFRETDWMDPITKERAQYKASKVVKHIGYPEELEDPRNIKRFYKGLKINKEHYFEAIIGLSQWTNTYTGLQLRRPNNKTDWRTHGNVAVVNAFYSPLENSIQFPAGILQQPFFDKRLPKYINYATLGMVMGHELTHGFDDQGSEFDFQGNLKEWWKQQSKKNFNKKRKCIIKQYSGFKDNQTQLNLNGINTQGENVADNGGIKLTYRAYKRLAKHLPREPRLPGLQQYNQDQLFFLSYANQWCTRYRTNTLKLLIILDPHSPNEFRVNGPLKNMREFSRIFRCRAGDPMNPRKKCAVW